MARHNQVRLDPAYQPDPRGVSPSPALEERVGERSRPSRSAPGGGSAEMYPSNRTRMKKHFPTFILALVAVIFAAGLLQLFRLRFAEGDVYPEYSSLRADPLGTMAFCESLEKIPGLTVRRDFSATDQLPEGKDTTYLHLAASTFEWRSMPEELLKEIEGFLTRGGRLAIPFFPETAKPWRFLDEHSTGEKDKS